MFLKWPMGNEKHKTRIKKILIGQVNAVTWFSAMYFTFTAFTCVVPCVLCVLQWF